MLLNRRASEQSESKSKHVFQMLEAFIIFEPLQYPSSAFHTSSLSEARPKGSLILGSCNSMEKRKILRINPHKWNKGELHDVKDWKELYEQVSF